MSGYCGGVAVHLPWMVKPKLSPQSHDERGRRSCDALSGYELGRHQRQCVREVAMWSQRDAEMLTQSRPQREVAASGQRACPLRAAAYRRKPPT
jgi:hypothetical protein